MVQIMLASCRSLHAVRQIDGTKLRLIASGYNSLRVFHLGDDRFCLFYLLICRFFFTSTHGFGQ